MLDAGGEELHTVGAADQQGCGSQRADTAQQERVVWYKEGQEGGAEEISKPIIKLSRSRRPRSRTPRRSLRVKGARKGAP